MTTQTVTVPNISCGHCTNTIEMEVNELDGVQSVQASEADKSVTVTWDVAVSPPEAVAVIV